MGLELRLAAKERGIYFYEKEEKGAIETQFKYYQHQILIPFMNNFWNKYSNFEVALVTNIPAEHTAVSWCDGDLSEIASITGELEMFVKNKIIVCKQNAEQLGREQLADLAIVFKALKKAINKHSVKDTTPAWHPMKTLITSAINSEELKSLNLCLTHRNALIDFISILS